MACAAWGREGGGEGKTLHTATPHFLDDFGGGGGRKQRPHYVCISTCPVCPCLVKERGEEGEGRKRLPPPDTYVYLQGRGDLLQKGGDRLVPCLPCEGQHTQTATTTSYNLLLTNTSYLFLGGLRGPPPGRLDRAGLGPHSLFPPSDI